MIRVLAYLVIVALALWAFIDVAQTPANRASVLPKGVWLLIALVPLVGAALWFLLGRAEVEAPGRRPQRPPAAPRPMGPDDDPEFLRRLGRGPRDGGP